MTKTVGGIAPEETARAYLNGFGVSLGLPADAADTAHTPRRRQPADATLAARGGGQAAQSGQYLRHDRSAHLVSHGQHRMRRIPAQLPVEEINRTSKGLASRRSATSVWMARGDLGAAAAGASTEVTRKNGQTPLLEACVNGHVPCVKLLLEAGADCNAVDGEGKSAMQLAEQSAKGSAAIKELLKEYGASE